MEKLSQHLNKDHEGVSSILCLKCAWPFDTAKEAGDHMRAEHYQDLKHIFCKGENVSSMYKLFLGLKIILFFSVIIGIKSRVIYKVTTFVPI